MGVSGNSVAGKSYQMFTVSEELLAKVVEAVQAGEKEARSSGNIQSFEVFCHGFRQNIALGRIYVVPASVCSDRKNFPTALLHGALVRVFGTGGEEISDLIEKRIGESEFDEYSQADFDSLKKELFVDPRTGKEASLIVFAPNWTNSREWITFHFTKDADQLKNNLRHQVFSAYFDPRVSSAFNALMTNVNTSKVDVTDITPKMPFPSLSENLLKQYPLLVKQAGNKTKVLLNHKTADEVTKQTLDPQELDVFDSLNQALENSLLPDVRDAESAGEGGYTKPQDGGVPREASQKSAKTKCWHPGNDYCKDVLAGRTCKAKPKEAKVAHVDANGICPGCKKSGNKCSCQGCTCKEASEGKKYECPECGLPVKNDGQFCGDCMQKVGSVSKACPDCGEPLDLDHSGCKGVEHDDQHGGWKTKAGTKTAGYVCPACESGVCGECKNINPSGNKPCTHGCYANQNKEAGAAHETPFTNVGPGTSAHDKQKDMVPAMKETVETAKASEEAGSPIGIAIDEKGVPRSKAEEAKIAKWAKVANRYYKTSSIKMTFGTDKVYFDMNGTKYMLAGDAANKFLDEWLPIHREMKAKADAERDSIVQKLVQKYMGQMEKRQTPTKKAPAPAQTAEPAEMAMAQHASEKFADSRRNPKTNKHDSSHPETLRVGQDRLSSAYSAAYNGGFVDKHAMPPKEVREYMANHMGKNSEYAPHSVADHSKMIEAGAYGETPFDRRAQEKWGSRSASSKKIAFTGDEFTDSYIETALWSSHDESTPSGGEPMDANYDYEDIAPSTLAAMKADCEKFQKENAQLLEQVYASGTRDGNPGHAGHDFWLTRNGHGAGFWDSDYPKPLGDALTEASKKYGEADLYVGDDGYIYQYGTETDETVPPREDYNPTPEDHGMMNSMGIQGSKKKATQADASYVASKMGKLVDSDGGYEAISEKSKKARTKKESLLNKFRSKNAVELDIDSIWDSITEDFGPAPLVDVDSSAPSQTSEGKSDEKPEGNHAEERTGRPNKKDVADLPEAFKSDEPEDEKAMSDSEAEAQEDSTPKASAWRMDSKFADFVEDVANDYDEAEDDRQRLSCNQCQMLSINGVACHERGCPNMGARWDAERGDWVKQRKCFDCGMTVDSDDPCCSAPPDDYEEEEATFGSETASTKNKKKADTADNPYNMKDGQGAPDNKKVTEKADTTGPTPVNTKQANGVQGDIAEARSEVVSPDTVDSDIQQPTVSVENAGEGKTADDVSGDISEAKSELDYSKSEMADEPKATDTVNPSKFAHPGKGNCAECGEMRELDKTDLCHECQRQLKSAAYGDESFEEVQFDFGAGDLADIVMTEDDDATS